MLAVARVAGIMAVKNTGMLVPLAHGGVGIEGGVVRVECVGGELGETDAENESENEHENENASTSAPAPSPAPSSDISDQSQNLHLPIPPHGGVRISALVETTGKTGVEMEALCGVVGAGLTVVDMVKGVDRGVVVEGVRVVGKRGGRRGVWGIWSG